MKQIKSVVELESWLVMTFVVCLMGLTAALAYHIGVEDGYWEHEAEENVYGCQVYYG